MFHGSMVTNGFLTVGQVGQHALPDPWIFSEPIQPRSTSIDLVVSRSLPDRHTSQLKCCEQILTSTLGVHCSAWVTEACSLADREAWGTTLEISWNQWKLRLSVGHLWCGAKGPGFDTDQAPVWQSALTSWGQSPSRVQECPKIEKHTSLASHGIPGPPFTILFHFHAESGRIHVNQKQQDIQVGWLPKICQPCISPISSDLVPNPHLTESKILEKLNQHLALTAT